MMFDIEPHAGAGSLRFGMSRGAVRAAMGVRPVEFARVAGDLLQAHFVAAGTFAVYDSLGDLAALEFADPAQPLLEGINFLGMPYEAARQKLGQLNGDEVVREEFGSLVADAVGVSLFSATAGSDCPIESVFVFRRGYYGGSNS